MPAASSAASAVSAPVSWPRSARCCGTFSISDVLGPAPRGAGPVPVEWAVEWRFRWAGGDRPSTYPLVTTRHRPGGLRAVEAHRDAQVVGRPLAADVAEAGVDPYHHLGGRGRIGVHGHRPGRRVITGGTGYRLAVRGTEPDRRRYRVRFEVAVEGEQHRARRRVGVAPDDLRRDRRGAELLDARREHGEGAVGRPRTEREPLLGLAGDRLAGLRVDGQPHP